MFWFFGSIFGTTLPEIFFTTKTLFYVSYNSYHNNNTMSLLFCRLFYCCHQIAKCWMFMMFLKLFVMFCSCSTFENDRVMVEISCVYIFCLFHPHILLINQLVLLKMQEPSSIRIKHYERYGIEIPDDL